MFKVKVTYIDQYDMMKPKAKIFSVFDWQEMFNKINNDYNFTQSILKIEKILSVSEEDTIIVDN